MRQCGAFWADSRTVHVIAFSVKDEERSGGWGIALCGAKGPMLPFTPDAPGCAKCEVAMLGFVPQPLKKTPRIWKMRAALVCQGCGKPMGEIPCSPGFEAFAHYGTCADCRIKNKGVVRPRGRTVPLSPRPRPPRPGPLAGRPARTADKEKRG